MVIDAHIHLYAEEVTRDPRAWAVKMREPHWQSCVVPEQGKSVQGWSSVKQLLLDMDASGVDQAVLLGWYWENHETCVAHNRFYAECIAQHPDRLHAFATVNPLAGKTALDEVDWAVEHGFVGLGEFLPQVQGYDLRHEAWLRVVERAVKLALPINLHVTETVGHEYVGRVETPLADYVWLAKEYPEAKLILAHWGGLLPFYELNPTVRKALKNVYYDMAASPLLYDKRIYEAVLAAVSPQKIIFGTDYPLLLQPKRLRKPSFQPILEQIETLNWPESIRSAVFCANIMDLISKRSC